MLNILRAEVTDCEYKLKVETSKPKSWLKTVCAFANTVGGSIIFGIEDIAFTTIGIENPQNDIEVISRLIKDRIDPLPSFEIQAFEEAPRTNIIVVNVKPDMHTPHYYKADGRREAFIRIGDESILAPAHVLNELILKGTNRTYDSLSTDIAFSSASFTVLRATYKLRTGLEFTGSDFVSFGLIDSNRKLTNGGALLSDEPFIRHSRIFCTRWNGLFKDEALDDAEYSGSLLYLLREGESFIKRHNTMSWQKTANSRINNPSYAERAVTECLVNALIHRDYLILGGEVHIDIYDNRASITSPGSMFNGDLPEDVANTNVESLRRNPVVADLFQRMDYMERRGSGLRKICHMTAIQDNYKPEYLPQFENDRYKFNVTLWDMNYQATHTTDFDIPAVTPLVTPPFAPLVEKMLQMIGEKEQSITELMKALDLSDKKNFRKNYLNPALSAGLIERTIPDKPNSRLQKYRRI